MAGLELRGLVVFVGELGTVTAQPGELLGSLGTAGAMRAVSAHRPRRKGAGLVRLKVHRRPGRGDRVRHGILLPHMQVELGILWAWKSAATLFQARSIQADLFRDEYLVTGMLSGSFARRRE